MTTRLALLSACLVLSTGPVYAQETPNDWTYKLTPSVYATSHQPTASDVNLRANLGPHAAWLGHYERAHADQQTRIGYEYTATFDWGQVVPSLQLATSGFAGGSLNFQAGHRLYAIAGLGRTNLRDYYNLNFDPNDAITLGLGGWLGKNHQLSVFTVQDDRLQTGQKVWHAVWRYYPHAENRLTLDWASKQGRTDGNPTSPTLRGQALAVTWDHQKIFVRLARDQKVNFTPDDQTRLSLGWRF